MNIIVTGGNGRIGKSVVPRLVEAGHQVMVLDRRPADRPGAKFHYLDLSRRELLQPLMDQADTLIHMGEIPNVRAGNTEEEVFGKNCTVGSLVFQLAAELKYKRVIYTSSIQVYGFMDFDHVAPLKLPVDESYPLQPQNTYAMSKVAIENYARNLCEKRGLSVAVFRLPFVITQEISDAWLARADHTRKLGGELGIYVRDTDVAEAFVLAIEKPRPGFEAYHLAAREVMHSQPIRESIIRDMPGYPRLPENWGKFDNAVSLEQVPRAFWLGAEV